MKRLLLIAVLAGAALWVGVAPATARPLQEDDQSEVAKKKKRDGGNEEKEEDVRRRAPGF